MKHTTITTKKNLAPGPRGGWLFRNLRDLRGDLLGTMSRSLATYGGIVRFRVGPQVIHLLSHPDVVHEVFVERTQDFLKLKPQRGLGIVLGNGLLTNDDHESWLSQRRMMQPMFHRHRLMTMVDKMTAAGERMLDRWQNLHSSGNGTVNIADEMMRVTLDIITKTMFSIDLLGEASKIGPAMKFATIFVVDQAQNPFSPPVSWPTPRNRTFHQAVRTLDEIIYRLIRQRMTSGEVYGDLLDMLLEARDADTNEGMSEQQVRDEVLTMFAAGHETTSSALTWIWYALAQHPEVLARLQSEVDSVLGERAPTMADLSRMPYIQHIFNEGQRLYPSGPILFRRAGSDTTLGGYHIPDQSLIFISVYNVHRHPEFWHDPTTFAPERWENEHNRLAFIPFGSGPHMCIGNNFAMLESQLLIAQIVQRYELRLVPDQRIETEVAITMRPRNGLLMTLHPRK
jgi:cytochrome P450